jgi:thymidylate synthase (FAD)
MNPMSLVGTLLEAKEPAGAGGRVAHVSVVEGVVPANRTVEVLDHGFVRLDDAMASDLSVVNAARVSFARRKVEMDDSDRGLIRFLLGERHGCYDDATEVLTESGWTRWPEVSGEESFATLSPAGRLEYQPALRLVRKEHRGHMVGFKGMSLDLNVTPDHRVLAAPLTQSEGRRSPTFSLRPANSVLGRAHRHTSTASWKGPTPAFLEVGGVRLAAAPLLRLVGFFIGVGNLPRSHALCFDLRNERELAYLRGLAAELGFDLRRWGSQTAVVVAPALRRLITRCYADREKVIPRELLALGPQLLGCLLDGLLESDGMRLERASGIEWRAFYTTSRRLADDLQELALKIGRSATVRRHRHRAGDGHHGRNDTWRVTLYAPQNSRPVLGRTRADASEQMGIDRYDGLIHCVEVPNGTLYVRRNGYPVWCGNTPFEHNAFRFHVRAPIFVAREWFRHRVGSFNEFSMRYARATDDFYVPAPEDVRTQVGKPGAYSFEPVEADVAETTREELRAVYATAFAAYERLVELGVARELARSVMPVGAYTEFYWTVNARSLMNFVSLRAAETAQREIRRYADACELFLAEEMPATYRAFVDAGRVAP